MSNPCIVVLTARSPARILAEGGSQAWRLNPSNAQRYNYLICVQNRTAGTWGGADQEHHAAFLVGKISGVVPSPERPERFLIKLSEYSATYIPNVWQGHRNPVRYSTLEEIGVDLAKLDWKPMPEPAPGAATPGKIETEDEGGIEPLTIAEAKAGLSLGLGVPEGSIEIIVRY